MIKLIPPEVDLYCRSIADNIGGKVAIKCHTPMIKIVALTLR